MIGNSCVQVRLNREHNLVTRTRKLLVVARVHMLVTCAHKLVPRAQNCCLSS